jgi:predicted DNA-binding transcriptional regulator YafY
MARNSELIRQWEILRDIDGARCGLTIPRLATARGVHPRTIRRDLDALGQAGFPLYCEKVNGTALWKLRARPFRALEETGLSVTELCAVYFSRSLMNACTGGPFHDDLDRAFSRLERALPEPVRTFLDALPVLMKAKPAARKREGRRTRDIVARATDAALRRRRVIMRYASASSARTREYVVEPQRISYADGGVYLIAFVPEYAQMRTFAAERIETLAVTDERFDPKPLPVEPFGDSLGVNTGRPEPIRIEFDASVAPYVKEREWHPSQQVDERTDGSILLTLDVCRDRPLRRWILSFGGLARVDSPARLAEEILAEVEAARERYVPHLKFAMAKMPVDAVLQPALPWRRIS